MCFYSAWRHRERSVDVMKSTWIYCYRILQDHHTDSLCLYDLGSPSGTPYEKG
jgi:hypothetical protein